MTQEANAGLPKGDRKPVPWTSSFAGGAA